MNQRSKRTDVLVLARPRNAGLELREAGLVTLLSRDEGERWLAWSHADESPDCVPREGDDWTPDVAGPHARWYAETPDLHVLFNTTAMSRINPLMVLNPYGSLIWRGVLNGWSVGRMRQESLRVFGADSVLSSLAHLAENGFVMPGPHGSPSDVQIPMEFHPPQVQFQLAQAAVPWYCLWELCSVCNLRCEVCYLDDFSGRGLSSMNLLEVADQIIATGISYVGLLGGEPLLRKDLETVVRRLRSAHVFVKVITNGTLLTSERAVRLAEAGLNQVEVSFDGLNAESHEASRGQGSFASALAGLANARAAGIPRQGMVWTMHSGNVDQLDGLPEFMDAHGLRECYLSLFKKTGLGGSQAPWDPPSTQALAVLDQRMEAWRTQHPELTIACIRECSCGRTSVVIGESGDVRLCTFAHNAVGNLRLKPLTEIWREIETQLPAFGPAAYCSKNPDRRTHLPQHASGRSG